MRHGTTSTTSTASASAEQDVSAQDAALVSRIDELVEHSSLGTTGAKALRQRPADGPEELVTAARRGDPEAWTELIARYADLVRATVAGFRLQEADAADAVQATWLRALERMDSLRSGDRLGGWLTTIAARECLAVLRKSRSETPVEAVANEYPGTGLGPEASVLAEEAKGAVRAAVAALPGQRQRLVHALFYRPERDYVSLADELGMPVGAIGPTRGRALRALRGALEPAGFDARRASSTRLTCRCGGWREVHGQRGCPMAAGVGDAAGA